MTRLLRACVSLVYDGCALRVSTTIMQTFACQTINGKWMLRAQLSLTCDPSSSRRRLWRNWAILNLLIYPIGFPLLLICLMLPQRARIRKNSF